MSTPIRIFAFHLLNDRSGSPKVLSQLARGWVEAGHEVHLYTSLHQDGFLSHIEGVSYHAGWYRFRSHPWLRLLYYTWSQVILGVKMFRLLTPRDMVYVNTILPFGAALLGKLKGCRVVYHLHESSISPAILKWFLLKVVTWTASDLIYVSRYVQTALGIKGIPQHLVYNAIEETYLAEVRPKAAVEQPAHVLMVCSLKAYKGLFEFLRLAADHPAYSFRLVLNAAPKAIEDFFAGTPIPGNLQLFPSQPSLHAFYQWADVIVNLSRPDGWVETFGLTIIEGMAYGLPAIVPPVGGILEVIDEGVTGFGVDSRDRDLLNARLRGLLEDPARYRACAQAAAQRLDLFREAGLLAKVHRIIAR